MQFVYNIRHAGNLPGIENHLNKGLHPLERVLKTFGHFEKRGDVLIEKLPNNQYLARIYLHLPKHFIRAEEKGFTPIEAVHKAANTATIQVIKIKESNYYSYKNH